MNQRQLIALPLRPSGEQKVDIIIIPISDVKSVNAVYDEEDCAYEVYATIGNERVEVALGLTQLLCAIGWMDIEDPHGVLQPILSLDEEPPNQG